MAFKELNWLQFDVWAIAANGGVVVVEPVHSEACHAWLACHDYRTNTIDFGDGIGPAVVEIGAIFRWKEQFGYALTSDSRNLDALRDGFEFDFSEGKGCVLEILHADAAYREDSRWFLGLLSIAAEYSRWQLALGNAFFTILVLPKWSVLEGVTYESRTIPLPFSTGAKARGPFDE